MQVMLKSSTGQDDLCKLPRLVSELVQNCVRIGMSRMERAYGISGRRRRHSTVF